MSGILRTSGQVVFLGLLGLMLGYFSNRPVYRHFPPDKALIKVSFVHSAKRFAKCRRLTSAEIAKLPVAKRRPLDCPRGRVPVRVKIELDGAILYQATLKPGGLFGDGPAILYKRFTVDPGPHHLRAQLADSPREHGYDFDSERDVVLRPAENFVIDFHGEMTGFTFE